MHVALGEQLLRDFADSALRTKPANVTCNHLYGSPHHKTSLKSHTIHRDRQTRWKQYQYQFITRQHSNADARY